MSRDTPPLVDRLADIRRVRNTRRVVLIVAFLAIFLAVGMVWALGAGEAQTVIGTQSSAATVVGAPGETSDPGESDLEDAIDPLDTVAIDFLGRWGSIADHHAVFAVDLATHEGTFRVTIEVENEATGWEGLQFEFHHQTGDCDASTTFNTPDSSETLTVQHVEDMISFTGLAGETVHCFGLSPASPANDEDGTWIRRPDPTTTVGLTPPEFHAMVWRTGD